MADEQIVTSIVAKGDFSNLIADVHKLTTSLSTLQTQVAGSNRALTGQIAATNAMFKETLQKTGQFSSHFVSLSSDVEKFGRNLDGGRLKLRDYFRVYQDHVKTSGGLVRDLAKQQVQLQNAVMQPLGKNAQGLMQYNVHIPRGLDVTKNKSALLNQELRIMNKVIQDGGVQLINWGKNTQWAGRQLTVGLTLPLVAFGKAAADAFKIADQELTRLTKVYGDIAGTSATELAKVRKDVAATAKELSSAMGVNFAETIGLAADIAATGKQGNDLLSSVSETTRLAVLGEVDRQEAMKATLAIQSAFKQNTQELSESINFLNAVENQTSTTLADLVEAIPKAGPVIKGLGVSVQDLALYLTAMREGGINASEGANALKSALASLINPTDVAVEKFQGFGIDLMGIVNKNAGNVTDTLLALQSALDQLNPLQKQQAIEQLFGKFQYSRLNALFENLGKQGSQTLQVMDLMKASSAELAGIAGRELAAVTESASGRFKRAVESLKADMAGVGDEFLNIATKLVNVLDKIINFAQKLPDPIKKILLFGGAFTAILGPVIMLTGVLANFFGYIVKGVGSFKALFKGAGGFKLLTPEIMAAQHASSLLGKEFYSDALAADTLSVAIKKLSEDLIALQNNAIAAKNATSTLGQVITTTAGAPIGQFGAARTVDEANRLLGGRSRAAAHMNPRDPNDPASIFGLTLQPIPVNRSIGRNPQILMNERLADVEGLTTIGGVSTGVVAGEHARYQALMATLGLQSRQEIDALKKTIKMGGTVSQEFIATFDDILPLTQQLTANATTQSAAIVAEVRAGKLSVEQARAQIIALNAQLERDLGIAVTQYGAMTGRTIDLTKAPLIDQPVVDAAGKPNTRGMFRQGIFRDVMKAVGRATRTRTMGGPYSIETTVPKLNDGGMIEGFGPNKTVVSGPTSINYDDRLGSVPLGGYVLNQRASMDPANADLVAMAPYTYENGGEITAALTPGEIVFGPKIQKDPALFAAIDAANNGYNYGGQIRSSQFNYGLPASAAMRAAYGYGLRTDFRSALQRTVMARTSSRGRDYSALGAFGRYRWLTRGDATADVLASYLRSLPASQRNKAAQIIEATAATLRRRDARTALTIESKHLDEDGILDLALKAKGLPAIDLERRIHDTHLTRALVDEQGRRFVSRYTVGYDAKSNLQANQNNLLVKDFLSRNMSRTGKYDKLLKAAGIDPKNWRSVEKQIDKNISNSLVGKERERIGDNPSKRSRILFEDFIPIIDSTIVANGGNAKALKELQKNTVARIRRNMGGVIPGYARGGSPQRAAYLYRQAMAAGSLADTVLPKSYLLKALGAKFGTREGGQGYAITSLPTNPNLRMFEGMGLSPAGQKALYGSLVDTVSWWKPRSLDKNVRRGFGRNDVNGIWHSTLGFIKNMNALPASDQAIINGFYEKASRMQMPMPESVVAKLFGGKKLNKGGSVGGGRVVPGRMNYGRAPIGFRRGEMGLGREAQRQGSFGLYNPGMVLQDQMMAPIRNAMFMYTGHLQALAAETVVQINKGSAVLTAAAKTSGSYISGAYQDSARKISNSARIASAQTRLLANSYAAGAVVMGRRASDRIRQEQLQKYRQAGYNLPPAMPVSSIPFGGQGLASQWKDLDDKGTKYRKVGSLGFRKYEFMDAQGRPISSQQAKLQGLTPPKYGPMGMGSNMAIGMAGTMAGSTLMAQGQTGLGMGVMAASTILPYALPGIMNKTSAGMRVAGEGIKKLATGGMKMGQVFNKIPTIIATIARYAKGLGPIGAIITAIGIGYKVFKDNQETQRLSALAFGQTAESAEKAGLKFTDYNEKIKEAVAAQKLLRDQNMATYKSLQQANTPLNITIQQFTDLRKEVKETMADQIKILNVTSNADILKVAVQLKEQFIAGGMSAEEATKKIYALFSLSNKSAMAGSAITSQAFLSITDASTAAVSAIQSFNNADQFENARDQAAAFNTALTAIDTGVQEIYNNSEKAAKKKGQEFDAANAMYEAEKKQLDLINTKVKNQAQLGHDVLGVLAKQNPEVAKFLNATDKIVTVYQKLRLVARGYVGDLSNMTAEQVNALYQLQTATVNAFATLNKAPGGALEKQYQAYGKLTARIKDLEKAAKGQTVRQQINTREELQLIDKKIKKINDEADARKKALQEQQSQEDYNVQLQKSQLEYQQALATGDMAAAARAQLDIRSTVSQRQTQLTEAAIEEDRLKKLKPLEARREAINKKQEKLGDAAALAAENLDKLRAEADKQKKIIDDVNNAMAALKIATDRHAEDLEAYKTSDEFKGLAGELIRATKAAGISTPTVTATSPETARQGDQAPKTIADQAMALVDKYGQSVDTIVASKGITVNGSTININGKAIETTGKLDPNKVGAGAGVEGSVSPQKVTTDTFGNKIMLPAGIYQMSTAQVGGVKNAQVGKILEVGKGKPVGPFQLESGKILIEGSIIIDKVDNATGKVQFKINKEIATKATGGLLKGPGTGTSDSILGMYANGGMVRVSNGEYIINAETVKNLGVPFFDAINGMKNGGLMVNYKIPRYADAGILDQTMAYKPSMTSNNAYNINVTLNGSNLSPEDVAKAIDQQMRMREAMSGRNRTIGG